MPRSAGGSPALPPSRTSPAQKLRVPSVTGVREHYTGIQADAGAEQAAASRDILYRQPEIDVWQAYYDVQTAAGGISSTETQVRSAEQSAQATLARYKAGFG